MVTPIVVPRSTWHPRPPVMNDGTTPRPRIPYFSNGIAVHYTGTRPISAARTQPASMFMPAFQRTAINSAKSFEYNALIPPRDDGQVWEYAGEYMGAHAGEAGKYEHNNSTRYAIQFTIGVTNHPSYTDYNPSKPTTWEPLTDAMVEAFRWWRHQLLEAGLVSPQVTPDRHLPGRATTCPGESVMARWDELLVPWAATAPKPDPTPIPPEDDDMKLAKIRVRGYANQFVCVPATAETNQLIGAVDEAPVVVDCNPAVFEQAAGFKLKPTADGQ